MMMNVCQQDLEEVFISNIEKNNIERVKKFLSSGFRVDTILRSRHIIWDTNYFSVLALASFAGSSEIVKFLINKKANVNLVDCLKNRTALHWAVASDNDEIVEILINAGANVNMPDRDSVTPLILASNLGNMTIVRILINKGSNMNHTDRMGTTALHYACMRFHVEIAYELIINGCYSNTNTPFSFCSPLKQLLYDKQYRVAKCLVESGCDLSNEKWIHDEKYFVKSNKNLIIDEKIMKWIRNYVKNPPKLMSLCRQSIRKNLGSYCLHEQLMRVNIPKDLIKYLQMKQ
jgi:ankyrin repeat protein